MDHNNAEIAPDSTRNDGPSVSNSAEANEEQLNDGNKEEIRMSKRQQRKERRRLRMLETRPEKRKLEREKRKRKRMGNNGSSGGLSLAKIRKQLKQRQMRNSGCKIRVAVDMSFDQLMIERDLKKTLSQLAYSYAANRRAPNPLQFYVVNFCGASRKIFDENEANKNWDVNFHAEDYLTLFPKEQIVYLTSESENVISDLDESKVYVIGGLIDHNAHKGLCFKIAREKGLTHGRLAIDEYVQMKTRKVLAINHVFEILLRFTETKDWKRSFFAVIPKRKGLEEKEEETDKNTEEIADTVIKEVNSSDKSAEIDTVTVEEKEVVEN